jgi:signal transduction histidine kinase
MKACRHFMRFISTLALMVPSASWNLSFAQFSEIAVGQKKERLNHMRDDTARINICLDLSNDYRYTNIDSSMAYSDKALLISRESGSKSHEAAALSQKGFIVLETGDLPQSLRYQFLALNLLEESADADAIAITLNRIGNIYMELGDFPKAIDYYRQSEKQFRKIKKMAFVYNEVSNVANVYGMMGKLDAAEFYMQQVYKFSLTNTDRYAITYPEMRDRYGYIKYLSGHTDSALFQYRIGITEGMKDVDFRNLASIYLHMAQLFFRTGRFDSSFSYAKKTIATAQQVFWKKAVYEASDLLSALFQNQGHSDSALIYARMSAAVKDSLYGPDKVRKLQGILLDEQQRQQQAEKERIQTAGKTRMYLLLAGLLVSLLVAVLLYRNIIHRKKANTHLQRQRDEIERQKFNLEATLKELKATQAQLIQSEKMASLGELTAGIAHEIQNPLNFVNNFSDVNAELIDEVEIEVDKGHISVAKEILRDLKANQEKINHHGKRADAIVKGMLQHSRTSAGQKEPTDINALADEYLRLAYHGHRAKDKSFTAKIETEFDSAIEKINIVPQEIGRVLLNLVNNAFYAVNEKTKQKVATYEPLVTVTTKKNGKLIEVNIKDNGIGMPDAIQAKIFQPFFTTRPTGQGTGLGLSLAYDIVKAHGGEMRVETKEGEGSVFIIQLPF